MVFPVTQSNSINLHMILVLPFLLWSFLFPSLLFCYYSFLTGYTCLSPNGLKGKGCIFFSLPCLTYKCGNEHYIWNIFWTLWWFSVLHLCKHCFLPCSESTASFGSFVPESFCVLQFSLPQSWDGFFWKHLLHTHLFLAESYHPRAWFSLPFAHSCSHYLGLLMICFLLSFSLRSVGFPLRTVSDFWRN